MTNESEIASRFAEFTGWISEHWPWLSGLVLGGVYVVKKVYQFFQGVNRLADGQAAFREEMTEKMDALTEEQRKQREKLDRMVDGPGVDSRVAPVIETVKTMQTQIFQIHDHMFNREPRERSTDK